MNIKNLRQGLAVSKKNIIIINGRQYDARSGALVTYAVPAPPAASPEIRPVVLKADPPPVVRQTVIRQAARHAAAHPPKHSTTLMRRAVKKPTPSHKHSLKAQVHLDTLAARPIGNVQVKPSVKRLDLQRLQHAQHTNRSRLVSRFSPDLFSGSWWSTPAAPTAGPPAAQASISRPAPLPRGKPKTTAELLDYALSQAGGHEQAPLKASRRSLFKRKARSAAA